MQSITFIDTFIYKIFCINIFLKMNLCVLLIIFGWFLGIRLELARVGLMLVGGKCMFCIKWYLEL